MFVTLVHVWVTPDAIEAFKTASHQNHLASIQEPDNLRFDVLQDSEDPCKFVLYEAYQSEAGAKAHKQTAHYQAWRETVAEMMAHPRQGQVHHSVSP